MSVPSPFYRASLARRMIHDVDDPAKAFRSLATRLDYEAEGKASRRDSLHLLRKHFDRLCRSLSGLGRRAEEGVPILVSPPVDETAAFVYIEANGLEKGPIRSILRERRESRGIVGLRMWFRILFLLLESVIYPWKRAKDVMFLYAILCSIHTNRDYRQKVYFWGRLYRVDYYLAALFLQDTCDIVFLTGSTLFFAGKKWTYLPKATLISASKTQAEEITMLSKSGYIEYGDLRVASPLYDESRVLKLAPRYTVGYYSSGEWARVNGLWRTDDYEGIRAGKYAANSYYRLASEILEGLVGLDVKFKVYPHPYERKLHQEYGINPPYMGMIQGHADISWEGKDSLSLLCETRIGVSIASTIIIERWDRGLDGFLYCGDSATAAIQIADPRYLPSRKGCFFSDVDELVAKIVRLM